MMKSEKDDRWKEREGKQNGKKYIKRLKGKKGRKENNKKRKVKYEGKKI